MKRFDDEFKDDFDDEDRGTQGTGGGEEGEGGRGGKSGDIGGPRISIEISRDDLLAPSEIRRLLKNHGELHKGFVDKQKILRQDRAALKEGRKTLNQMRRAGLGMGGGNVSRFKKHPISDRAQFSGMMDSQVTLDPLKNDADTNAEARNENELKFNLRFQPQRTFNPKPSPF